MEEGTAEVIAGDGTAEGVVRETIEVVGAGLVKDFRGDRLQMETYPGVSEEVLKIEAVINAHNVGNMIEAQSRQM